MNGFQNWLHGYVKLMVSGGSTERFLSLLKGRNIQIWEIVPLQDGYSFYLGRRQVRELNAIRKKTGTHVKILEKHGLPFLLFRYRKRKFLVLGFVLSACMVFYGSLFVWDINVDGTMYYTEEEIRSRIEEHYVTLGQRKAEIDCDELEEHLREDFPDISWISCELIGTQLNVVIKETLDGSETIVDESTPQDLIAAKDGTIVEMITRNGTPVKHRGETVQKGDVLISGTIYIYDDYDEILESDYVVADGDVIGETTYTFTDSFELQYYEKEYTSRTKHSVSIQLFNYTLPLKLPGKEFLHYDETQQTHSLRFGNTYILPCSITISEMREYEPVLHEYSAEEANERMNARLDRYLEELNEKEVQIMENHVTITIENNECRASGSIVCWERIGYGRPIHTINQSTE